jgi:hypothetical protein
LYADLETYPNNTRSSFNFPRDAESCRSIESPRAIRLPHHDTREFRQKRARDNLLPDRHRFRMGENPPYEGPNHFNPRHSSSASPFSILLETSLRLAKTSIAKSRFRQGFDRFLPGICSQAREWQLTE